MAEEQPEQSDPPKVTQNRSFLRQRKGFISPTSSFIDFGTLETEYYTPEAIAEADSYSPHDHRSLKKPITDFETATHVLKGSVGAGIMAMPKAFSNIGVIPGIILTAILTVLCIYAIHILIKTQYIQCQRLRTPFLALPTSMRIGFKNGPRCLRCFAPIAPIIVDFFLVFYQLGICTAYVIFVADALKNIIALEHNMEKADHFLGCWGIFPWCLTVVAILYLVFGLLGYLKYGEDVKDTIFSSLPKDELLAIIIYSIYGFCIFLSYPLQCFVSLEILWGNYIRHIVKDPLKECIFEYILRTVTVIITFVVAAAVPSIDLVISLVGAFCISTLAMIFPFVLELCTKWPDQLGACKYILIKDILLIVLGFFILVIGTYTAVYSYVTSKPEK